MQSVPLGTRVKPMGISRVSVADGCVRRAILLDNNPQFKYVAWDDNIKRRVEVDQDLVVNYGLSPSTTFYYLVAMLNTDMTGNVVNDQFTVEFLQLSENQNNDFGTALAEMGTFNSIHLSKVVKKGDGGKDFSYVQAKPSNYTVDHISGLMDKIRALQSDQAAIASLWQFVDVATSISKEQYLKLMAEKDAAQNPQALEGAQRAAVPPHTTPMVQAPQYPTVYPQNASSTAVKAAAPAQKQTPAYNPQIQSSPMPHGNPVNSFESDGFSNPEEFNDDNF